MIAILIPAYNPEISLLKNLIKKIQSLLPDLPICVVNDGSDNFSSDLKDFLKISKVKLFEHDHNLGKGAALKTGIHAIREFNPSISSIITVDADGQHLPEDVVRLVQEVHAHPERFILGVREFEPTKVPLRSRFGNILTRKVFTLFTGKELTDTQMGLRAIPSSLFDLAASIDADRYDYELEFLLAAVEINAPMGQMPIKTVYLDKNSSSHFRPLVDSLRIYFVFLRFIAVSLLSALIDFSMFFIFYYFTGSMFGAFLMGRFISASCNYWMNRHFSFHSSRSMNYTLWRYILLAVFIYFGVYGTLVGLTHEGLNVYVSKLIAESIWFILSFLVQRFWLFRH